MGDDAISSHGYNISWGADTSPPPLSCRTLLREATPEGWTVRDASETVASVSSRSAAIRKQLFDDVWASEVRRGLRGLINHSVPTAIQVDHGCHSVRTTR
jgi:hypothetical protein